MKRILPALLLIFLAGFSITASGQIGKAERQMKLYNYSGALEILHKALLQKSTDKRVANLMIAECYRKQLNASMARNWYARVVVDSTAEAVNFLYYAQALRSCGDYAAARRTFLVYDSLLPLDRRGKQYASWCDSVEVWRRVTPSFIIKNEAVLNSKESDFGPVLYRNGLVFTSDRATSDFAGKAYGWTGNSYLRLFYANRDPAPDGVQCFTRPASVSWLPEGSRHYGPATFNGTFDEMFVNGTALYRDKGKQDPENIRTHLLKIFTARLSNGRWSKPEPFFMNNDTFSVGHPFLSADGATLLFVSDREGGFGGTDIYKCCRKNGVWEAPVNLGPDINTPGNEMFPYLGVKDELWFASDGWPGYGGLDIFVAHLGSNPGTLPENLREPINSCSDDFSLIFFADTVTGIFSSNRIGGLGGDDLYRFSRLPDDTAVTTLPPQAVVLPDSLQANRTFVLTSIYYDLDRWDIRHDATASLDHLVTVMKENAIRIELSSHTDCRAGDGYNTELSQKRAESARRYLISHGIDPSRVIAKGYGETKPVNRCVNGVPCSEAEHQQNRRTEFTVLTPALN